jgi:hypothetical protein
LLGSPMSVRSFKLPNPMYYILWQILKKGRVKDAVFYLMHFAPDPIEKLRIIWQWNFNCTKASLAQCSILHTLPVSSNVMVEMRRVTLWIIGGSGIALHWKVKTTGWQFPRSLQLGMKVVGRRV